MPHGEKRRRKQDLKFKCLLCLQCWNTATCCSSLEKFGSQSSREQVSHSVLTLPSLYLVYISKKLPYEPGHAQDFFLYINSDTKKLDFHTTAAVLKKKKERILICQLLRDYASLWTFAEHFYQTVELRSLSGELFPFLEPNHPGVD